VGGDTDGVPGGLDNSCRDVEDAVPYNGWPAGRGAEQYPWEPPRVVEGKSVPGRSARIKMLGNAVVPAQAAVLFREIVEIHNAIT